MGQIPRSTERISSYYYYYRKKDLGGVMSKDCKDFTNAKDSDKTRVRRKVRTEYLSDAIVWHNKFSIYYKFVIVIDLVYAQHVTE